MSADATELQIRKKHSFWWTDLISTVSKGSLVSLVAVAVLALVLFFVTLFEAESSELDANLFSRQDPYLLVTPHLQNTSDVRILCRMLAKHGHCARSPTSLSPMRTIIDPVVVLSLTDKFYPIRG